MTRPIPYSPSPMARHESRGLRLIALDAQHAADLRDLRFGFWLTIALDIILAAIICLSLYNH